MKFRHRFSRSVFRKAAVYVIAAGCLTWVLRGVHLDELLLHMRSMHLRWIPPAILLDVFCTVIHGFRWKLLVRPSGDMTLLRTTQAIYVGLFTNELLPIKLGEFARGYLVSRWIGIPFTSILPSMITERIFDASFLVLGLVLMAFFVSLPQAIVNAGVIVGTAVIIVIALLIALVFIEQKSSFTRPTDFVKRWRAVERIIASFSYFTSGLRTLWASVHFSPVLVLTLLYIFSQVLSFWLVMKAFGFQFSLWVPVVVLTIVRLGTAVPNAPGNIGPHQFFCVLSLMLFGVEKTMATGFAVVLWIVFSIPILVLGFLAFIGSGLSLSDLRKGNHQTILR